MRIDDQLRHQLARELVALFDGWTTTEIAARGLQPARISALRRGRVAGFTLDRLVRMIAERGYDIEIVIRPKPRPTIIRSEPQGTVVRGPATAGPCPAHFPDSQAAICSPPVGPP